MISLPLTEQELLACVRPPYPNAFFPLGAGARAVLIVLAGAWVLSRLYRLTPKYKRRAEAIAALDAAGRRYMKQGDASALASDVSVVLRRSSLARFGREKTAGLNGRNWTDFLERTGADLNERDRFLLQETAFAPFEPDGDLKDGRHLIATARKWLEKNL